jgi:cellobiose phosphorylase
MQELTDLLNDMISSLKIYNEDKERPSLFVLHSYQMVPAEVDLLFTVARIVFTEQTGVYFRNIKDSLKETDDE